MDTVRKHRWALHLLAAICCLCAAQARPQGALPATAPTNLSVSQLPSARPAASAGSTADAAGLHWDGRLLQVQASNSSLNRLLHSIAAKTGTELVGSVPEDRIFGTYGPAPMAEVIAAMLEGLPVNVMFVDHTANKPAALTLTSRNGGASPTMPQQAAFNEPAQSGSFAGNRSFGSASLRDGQVPPPEVPAGTSDAPVAGMPVAGAGDAPSTTSANPASPNGVKTPEEIFEQLQRLRATALGK